VSAVHLWDRIRRGFRPDTTLRLPSADRVITAVELLTGAEATAGQIHRTLGGRWPRRLGLLADNGEPWVRALFATLRLDATVVPLPLPVAFAGPDAYIAHLVRLAEDARLDAVLISPGFAPRTVGLLGKALPKLPLIDISAPVDEPAPPPLDGRGGDAEAVIQYTSGSTSRPKGVVLSHDNVAAGLDTINAGIGWRDDDVMGLWLPLFHDMGLFSMLSAFVRGSSVCLWTPGEFVRRPLRWLESFASSGATALPAPNFFYDYLVAAAGRDGVPDGLDLSRWRLASNGAEPVQARTIAAFDAVFGRHGVRPELIRPTYGMAEATLMVSFAPTGEPVRTLDIDRDHVSVGAPIRTDQSDRSRNVVSCGPAAPGMRLRVAEDAGELPEGVVGEVQIDGPAVTSGYLGRPAEEQPFTSDGWLRTGDLGFLLDGELFIVGRSKDMIVVRGQNYYAEDVEEIVRGTPGVNGRRSTAFAWDTGGDELMVVLWESRLDAEESTVVSEDIRVRLTEQLGLAAVQVVAVPPSTIPFTSSGKVKRAGAAELCRKKNLLAAGVGAELSKGASR
jgi:fatty-acyl-CoA synthase